jgi:hypothetical protein
VTPIWYSFGEPSRFLEWLEEGMLIMTANCSPSDRSLSTEGSWASTVCSSVFVVGFGFGVECKKDIWKGMCIKRVAGLSGGGSGTVFRWMIEPANGCMISLE